MRNADPASFSRSIQPVAWIGIELFINRSVVRLIKPSAGIVQRVTRICLGALHFAWPQRRATLGGITCGSAFPAGSQYLSTIDTVGCSAEDEMGFGKEEFDRDKLGRVVAVQTSMA